MVQPISPEALQAARRPLRVLLVTSWNTPCGIAEFAKLLKESVEKADPKIEILPDSESLDPTVCLSRLDWTNTGRNDGGRYDRVHLNHHDGLHSRWTADHVRAIRAGGTEVLVTYHDTTEDPSPTSKLADLAGAASSVVIHEPLHPDNPIKAIYWRQGVPGPAILPAQYHSTYGMYAWRDGERVIYPSPWKAYDQQPVLGTVGFHFPWKNYDKLAQVTGEMGWALVILSNNATEEDEQRWKSLNSSILVVRKFLPQDVVINYLAGCDATAFMYECANTGTSGAIRQGIAARKRVIALKTCRQFRDLVQETDAIDWVDDWDGLRHELGAICPHPFDPPMLQLANEESWDKLGANYAKLYRMLAAKS